MLSHAVNPAWPRRERGYGRRLSWSAAREAACWEAIRDCASRSRVCLRIASRCCASAKSLDMVNRALGVLGVLSAVILVLAANKQHKYSVFGSHAMFIGRGEVRRGEG